jgi:hypothetical protein
MRLPKKISALPGVSTIKNADLFAIVQDGVTSKVTFQVLEGIISGFTASADTYVTGGVYNSGTTSIDFTGNTDFPPFSVNVSGLTGTFTGNTSGDCITDLWVDNVYGCSPITMHDTMVFENADESLHYTGGTKLHFIRFDTDFDELLTPIGNSVVVGAIPDNNLGQPSGSYIVLSEDRIIKLVIDSGATASDVLVIGDTTLSDVTQELATYAGSSFKNVGTLLNVSDSIIGTGTSLTTIISSEDSMINDNVTNSVILGGSNITGTTNDTVYVPNLNIGTVGGGTPVNNLGIDSDGYVVDSGVSIQEAKLVILSGDVLQLNSIPQQIIAAPGAGKIIDVINVVGKIDYGTTDYDTNTTLALKFTGATDNMVQEAGSSPFLSMSISAIKKITIPDGNITDTQIIENESLYVTVNTGNPANGDSTITIYVTYKITTL